MQLADFMALTRVDSAVELVMPETPVLEGQELDLASVESFELEPRMGSEAWWL